MYCMKCGKEISNESKFCLHCGTPVGAADGGSSGVFIPPVMNATAAPSGAPRLQWKPPATTATSFMGTGFGWVFFAILFSLSYAFFSAVLPHEIVSSIRIISFLSPRIPFGEIFGASFLVGIISFALFAVGYWLIYCLHHQEWANFCKTSNALSESLVPLTCAFLLSMLLGLFWFEGIIFVILFGLVYLIAGLCQKYQAIDIGSRDPIWGLSFVITGLLVLVVVIAFNLYDAML